MSRNISRASGTKRTSFRVGNTLRLPTVIWTTKTRGRETIQCVLDDAREDKIKAVVEIKVNKTTKGQELHLESGHTVVIVNRKKTQIKSTLNCVLSIKGEWSWIKHPLLTDYEQKAKSPSLLKKQMSKDWRRSFVFNEECIDEDGNKVDGLRPPQIGALHAIGAHWSLSSQPATVVMPTGTGKTETMIGASLAYHQGTILVVVPSKLLRDQTEGKFLRLGLLRKLNCIPVELKNPIIGTLYSRPKTIKDLDIFDRCHVVITTMSAIAQGTAVKFVDQIAAKCSVLLVDEAHHIPADTWLSFRDAFKSQKVLQFTATPFRRDGKQLDGKPIYTYPLASAQKDGYFKKINFIPINQPDPDLVDIAVAEAAIKQLDADLENGLDHILMARCETIRKAKEILAIYNSLAASHSPIIVHSKGTKAERSLAKLHDRSSRIVVCVDMLGEGYDLPELKIAALHSPHKSLSVLLQFTGRFTRVASASIGEASVIANIATDSFGIALEKLFREDADWNKLLSGFAGEATKEHQELNEFLQECERLDDDGESEQKASISQKSLVPRFSFVVYKSTKFTPKSFHKAIPKDVEVAAVWHNKKKGVLFFITRQYPKLKWCKNKSINDREWHLHICYYNEVNQLLLIHSSDHDLIHSQLASAVSDDKARIIQGDNIFRALSGVNRLLFHNIGLKRPGRRNLRYSMYTGANVKEALSTAQTTGSLKSNLFGAGYAGGLPVTIGCSAKGKVWSHDAGLIPRFLKWCDSVANKVIDDNISTTEILNHVLIPNEVTALPNKNILAIEFPIEILNRNEEGIDLIDGQEESSISNYSIEICEQRDPSKLSFRIFNSKQSSEYSFEVGSQYAFKVTHISGTNLSIRIGRRTSSLVDWLNEYPPKIIYVDNSELDGNLLIEPSTLKAIEFPTDLISIWDWSKVDIQKESIWKGSTKRDDSIQQRAFTEFKNQYDLIFDDDDPGEAADLVCLKEEEESISMLLVHCKFSGSSDPGARVKDAVEVCAQAIRSRRWHWKFKDLCKHLLSREKKPGKRTTGTRYLKGNSRGIARLMHSCKFKPIQTKILIVQPGISQSSLTDAQKEVLAAANAYLLETIEVPLKLAGSA